jgi:S-adenosylmethionine-diacylglycerol 3-amino-3-carboxypropyl transferase
MTPPSPEPATDPGGVAQRGGRAAAQNAPAGSAARRSAEGPAPLEQLVFTLSWEDPALDRAAFGQLGGRDVCTVSSGGCNAITFLLDDPASVLAFDYNQSQTHVLELKLAALRALDHAGLLELLGVRPSARRAELLRELQALLSESARDYWARAPWLLSKGLLGGGRYERFVSAFRRFLRVIQGQQRITGLFADHAAAERRRYYDEQWDTWAWRLLFKAFFNKTLLARRGLSADYFSFDDGSRSFAEQFSRRAAHALRDLPVRDNPFLAQYLLGRYLDEEHLPDWLRPENFALLRERCHRVRPLTADAREVFAGRERAFDAICLSNVCELMSESDTERTLAGAARALTSGGRLTLRNLMVPRRAPDTLRAALLLDRERSESLLATDRAFVYGAFLVYARGLDNV